MGRLSLKLPRPTAYSVLSGTLRPGIVKYRDVISVLYMLVLRHYCGTSQCRLHIEVEHRSSCLGLLF